jgi:hypothetical protein
MADTFRVVIDVERIRANLWTHEQARLTEAEIRYWLQSVGFRPETPDPSGTPERPGEGGGEGGAVEPLQPPGQDAGNVWLADAEALRRLDQSEVISVRPL